MILIGLSTFRELLRQKLVHIILFLAGLILAVSFMAGTLSLGEEDRILFHFGFSAVQLALVGISLFVGSITIPREIERQTCLIVLTRPIDRLQFYLGKWLGVAAVNAVIVVSLTLILWFAVGVKDSFWTVSKVGLGIYFESLILLALAFWSSMFLRSAISLFFSMGIFILGHWLNELVYFAEKSKIEINILLSKVIHAIVPQLYRTDWKSFYLLENNLISSTEFLTVTLHAAGWILLLLVLGVWNFRRKDLV